MGWWGQEGAFGRLRAVDIGAESTAGWARTKSEFRRVGLQFAEHLGEEGGRRVQPQHVFAVARHYRHTSLPEFVAILK